MTTKRWSIHIEHIDAESRVICENSRFGVIVGTVCQLQTLVVHGILMYTNIKHPLGSLDFLPQYKAGGFVWGRLMLHTDRRGRQAVLAQPKGLLLADPDGLRKTRMKEKYRYLIRTFQRLWTFRGEILVSCILGYPHCHL